MQFFSFKNKFASKNYTHYGGYNLQQTIHPVLFPSGIIKTGKHKKYTGSIRSLPAKPVRNRFVSLCKRVQDIQVRAFAAAIGTTIATTVALPTATTPPTPTLIATTIMVFVGFVVRSGVNIYMFM